MLNDLNYILPHQYTKKTKSRFGIERKNLYIHIIESREQKHYDFKTILLIHSFSRKKKV